MCGHDIQLQRHLGKTITIHTHQTPGNGKEEEEEGEMAHLAAALALKDV